MKKLPEEYIEISGEPFIVAMMYATPQNMTQTAVYEKIGFGNRAIVHKDMWEKISKLIPVLKQEKLKLKIFDAYRPPLAHKMLKEIIPMDGFFAASPERSQHCRATAIDICLCDENGKELAYPTKVDAYTPYFAEQIRQGKADEFFIHLQKARHDYFAPEMETEIKNREYLKQLMLNIGLEPIPHEWWHYNLPGGNAYPMPEI